MGTPILQFGTSRFLQAHADLFIGEALEQEQEQERGQGQALGRITVVQSTTSEQSARRVAAFNAPGGYPVRIRGCVDGKVIDREQRVTSIAAGLQAARDWPAIRELAAGEVQVILSNTGEQGYALAPQDTPAL